MLWYGVFGQLCLECADVFGFCDGSWQLIPQWDCAWIEGVSMIILRCRDMLECMCMLESCTGVMWYEVEMAVYGY